MQPPPQANPWRLNANCNRVRCEPGWHLDAAWAGRLRDYDLWFVWAGRGRMITSDGAIDLRPGLCLWMQPGRHYEASHDPAAPLGVNFFHFEAHQPNPGFSPPFEVMNTAHTEFADTVMRRILALHAESNPGAQHSAEAWFAGLLAELTRESEQRPSNSTEAGIDLHHRRVVHRITADIRENPARPHAVAELARAAGYSVDHFSRIFEKINGRRPQEFVIEERLTRARQLLAETGLSVGEIADTLGFSDVYFFSRQFRQRVGTTPSRYRASLSTQAPSTS